MATVPAPRTWTASELVTAAKLNADIRDSFNFLLKTPFAKLRKNASQSITSGLETKITWEVEVYDTDNGHSNVTNNTRYTSATAGWYHYSVCLRITGSSAGQREMVLMKNGSSALRQSRSDRFPSGSHGGSGIQTSGHIFLAVGDYLEVAIWQNSGVTNTIFYTASWSGADMASNPSFDLRWVHS